MEKDIGKIQKNPQTDIVIRIDDFAGRAGLTIREFSNSERYTGFTKSGTKIPSDKFAEFKAMINAITDEDLKAIEAAAAASQPSGEGQGASAGADAGASAGQASLPAENTASTEDSGSEEAKEDY